MQYDKKLNQLKEATQALALSYEDQIALFPDFVLITDELVLEYDEAFKYINELINQELITAQEAISFKKIDEYSQYLSDNFTELFLNPKSLETDLKWEDLRKLARKALENMDWELEKPKFSHTIYLCKKK